MSFLRRFHGQCFNGLELVVVVAAERAAAVPQYHSTVHCPTYTREATREG